MTTSDKIRISVLVLAALTTLLFSAAFPPIRKALPWRVKAALARVSIIEWRPDCLSGLVQWHDSEAILVDEGLGGNRLLSQEEQDKAHKYLTDKWNINP